MKEINDDVYLNAFNRVGKNDIQNVFTPPRIIRRMLNNIKLKEDCKILIWYNVEFLIYLVKEIGFSPKNIYIYTNTKNKLILEKQGYNVFYQDKVDFYKISNELKKMKFDVILGNPPYQEKVGPKKTESLWNKFFHISIDRLEEGGYLSLIHPNGWRNIEGKYKNVQEKIKSKNLQFLSINNVEDGQKLFNATTPFDWYVLKNVEYEGITTIKFQDGSVSQTNISNLDFIPNDNFEIVKSLISNEKESSVNIIYSRSDYGTDKVNVSKIQNDEFPYPVVYSILSDGTVNLMYSSTNTKGHFGIPKLILGNGANPTCFIDYNGEYGMTQFAYGIVDTVENLVKIKKVITSKDFQKVNLATKYVATAGNPLVYPKILKTFRKNFWKEFIDE
jgi:hypothetical protein